MTDYYVDPAASGSNNGTDWTNAWTNLQTAADTVTAGNTVYCRGTQTQSAIIDFDTQSGNTTSGQIKYIGTNGSGTVDGTKFVVDANSSYTRCLYLNGADYILFSDFEFKNSTDTGVYSSSASTDLTFIDCSSHNNTADGFRLLGIRNNVLKCQGYSNTQAGIRTGGASSIMWACATWANGNRGIYISAGDGNAIIACISQDDNATNPGIETLNRTLVYNCVCNNAEDGLFVGTGDHIVAIGNRLTNNARYGLNSTTGGHFLTYGFNFFYDNTTADISVSGQGNWAILDDSYADSNDISGGDADDGYNNTTNDDMNLKASRTYNGDGADTMSLKIGS